MGIWAVRALFIFAIVTPPPRMLTRRKTPCRFGAADTKKYDAELNKTDPYFANTRWFKL